MSQCVPSWDFDENPSPTPRLSLRSNSNSTAPDVPMLDYELVELTWENGQLAMHRLDPPRGPVKPIPSTTSLTKYNTSDKPRASGTLESIVNQATLIPHHHHHRNHNSNNHGQKPRSFDGGGGNDMVPWLQHRLAVATATSSATMTRDALVPCSNHTDDQTTTQGGLGGSGTRVVECSTRVGSCSSPVGGGTLTHDQDENVIIKHANKEARVAVPAAAAAPEWSSRDQSTSGSATCGRDSQHVTLDTCERDLGVGFTSTSLCSMENTSPGKPCTKATTTSDDHDSVCHSRPQREAGDVQDKKKSSAKSSVSTKRSRAAAIHNKSEQKRRDKINQRMKTLQKLVPNSSKTDKALMLDEVIEYLKQLQAQVQMMSRMSMPPMMLPIAMQQQRQMSMMAPMGMGMGMGMGLGMGMDMNNINRSNITGISPVLHSTAFMPMTSWDAGSGDRIQATSPTVMADPFSTFLACQSQVLCISNKNKTQRAKSCKVLPLHFPLRRMDTNKFSDLRPDGNEQELHLYTKWLAVFGFMLGSLLIFLGWKYQSPDVSLLDIHGAIMLLLIIDVCIFTISMAVTILPNFKRIHLPFFKGVFLISGVLACDLILLMLAPPFGWFIFTICASVMVLLLYRSHREILQRCQEILEPMWHSTFETFHGLCDWFQRSFQSIWTAPSQASNGSSLPTPNMKEKHVLGSENNVQRDHMFLI